MIVELISYGLQSQPQTDSFPEHTPLLYRTQQAFLILSLMLMLSHFFKHSYDIMLALFLETFCQETIDLRPYLFVYHTLFTILNFK